MRKTGSFSQWPVFADELFETMETLPEPYFVWVFLMDTHNPYIVPREDRVENSTLDMYYGMLRGNSQLRHSSGDSYLADDIPPGVERRIVRAYRDSVRSVDRFTGALCEHVDTDDTSVVFTADHGEAFNEHGTYGHQNALYQENVHVPLLVYEGCDEGHVVDDPVSLRSLPELLLALGAGEGVPVESLTGSPVVSRTASGDTLAVTGRRWKYITTPDGDELYDLERDPGETENLAGEETDYDDVREEFEGAIEAYLQRVPDAGEDEDDAELSDEVRSQLETLGYV
jgi:arylsulfatase A-like enzyme